MSDNKLKIKQISGKPAVKYSDIEPGVVFTFNEGSIYGEVARIKTMHGRLNLSTMVSKIDRVGNPTDGQALCTVYKSTLTLEV